MGRSIRVGTFFGVYVAIDWSWIPTFVLAAWTLVAASAMVLPGFGVLALALLGALAALALIIALVAHEAVRTGVLRAQGVPVRSLTFFLFGALTDVDPGRSSPRREAVAAVAALAANVALAVLSTVASAALEAVPALFASSAVLAWFGIANVAVALVHLVPAYPLDAGRLLRAGVWRATGDPERASRWSAVVSQIVGWSVLAAGVAVAFAGGLLSVPVGMWLAFAGWFLASAAAQAHAALRREAPGQVTVAHLARPRVEAVPGDVTVATGVRRWLMRAGGALPVVEGDRLLGVVSMEEARALPEEDWRSTALAEIARSAEGLVVAPEEEPEEALRKLGDGVDRLLVVDGARLLGVVDRRDLQRAARARRDTPALREATV